MTLCILVAENSYSCFACDIKNYDRSCFLKSLRGEIVQLSGVSGTTTFYEES